MSAFALSLAAKLKFWPVSDSPKHSTLSEPDAACRQGAPCRLRSAQVRTVAFARSNAEKVSSRVTKCACASKSDDRVLSGRLFFSQLLSSFWHNRTTYGSCLIRRPKLRQF